MGETDDRLFTIYRMVRNIMAPFLDGFYPLNSELKKSAEGIHIKYSADMSEQDLQAPVDAFMMFAKGLKTQISQDFKYINTTLITLLEQVKDLERTLSRELGENDRLKDMDLFEKRINKEFGFILESFDVSATINDIRQR